MNNFPKSHENLQDPKYIAPLVNKPPLPDRAPLYLHDFHQSNTSPNPAMPKVTVYPESWDKHKKRLSAHQIAEIILSNRQFVIVCTVIMSAIFTVYALKLVFAVIMK